MTHQISGISGIDTITLNSPAGPSFGAQGSTVLTGMHGLSLGAEQIFKKAHPFSGMDIRLTPAIGGTIISIHNNHSSQPDLYIIDESKDLGAELGKIVTMACLTRDKHE